MSDASGTNPELTSMTRRRAISPLVAAWAFVLVLLGGVVAWLSLSSEEMPAEEQPPEVVMSEENPSTPKANETALPMGQSEPQSTNVSSLPNQSIDVQPEEPMSAAADPMPAPKERMALRPAPISGLTVEGANGPLPVLGPDGMVAWKEYARPFNSLTTLPRIAIVVTGIGLNSQASRSAIQNLPEEVTMGFSPYGKNLQDWMDDTRAYGHESILMLPMEPLNYPENDPGPHTLMSTFTKRDNLKRLDWLLSQVTGYVGVMNDMGSKFTASEEAIQPVLEDLNGRGLLFLDAKSSRYSVAAKLARRINMPRAINNRYIDNKVSSAEISKRLQELESTAKTFGAALGIARAYPLSIQELKKWAEDLEERGFQLVPVSAVANRQPVK